MLTVISFQQWRVPTLYEHVGKIAVEWGFMDFAVMGATAALFAIPEAAKREKVAPRGLARRLSFIARSLKEIAPLAPFQAEGQELIDRARKIQPIRDGVVHGFPSLYEIETGKVVFMNLDVDGTQQSHEMDQTVVTLADLIGTGFICHRLGADFSTFAYKIADSGVVPVES